MAIGQPTPDTHIEVVSTSRPQSRFNCCVNRQRLHSIITGMVIFSYGGMGMAQGLGWNRYTGIADSYQFEFSWFIGVIIGAILSALAFVHVPKFYFYALAIVMQLIDAIICVSAPYNYEAMVAARYIGGIAIGFITVPFIIHNSEVAPSNARGKWCAVEQSGLGLGIAIQVIMDSMWNPALSIGNNQVHGIIGIVFAIIAIAILMLSVESPIFQLRRNDYVKANTCQWELMDKNATSEDHNEALEENKRYVSEGSHESLGHDLSASMIPFIKMFFCRCLVAFSFSAPLTKTIIASSVVWKGTMYSWPIIVWRILRWIGTLVAILVMDKLGRKLLSMVCRISMVFQMFAGLFVACTPAYMGEAFPMRVKPFMIALIVCIEQVIHIIVIVTFDRNPYCFFQYYLSVGIILLISMLILLAMLPETRKMTLRQAGYRFRRLHDIWAH
ncbi:proton myo-inositol cotransporter hmit-1.3-like isoform X2 [Drosophila montana]|uniref:proton myo-inositol cotransporter hmit-1.3-like isoform X2 n=1 Tax=Drosophila montana TaxID=40370 RepID=UPI00313D076E